MPEYKILSYSWTVERLRNELHFPQYPPFLNEVYESDEEYYRDGFGKHHTDVQKVLSHAAWSYNRFTADQSLKGDLVRDFKNLLHCLSHVAVRDYVDQYLKMLCGLGLGKEACRVLTEYLENCQGRKEGERISYKEALSLKDTYVNAGDQALFLKEDADTAIGFYKLVGADWNTDRVDYGKDSNSGMWRRKASAYEKL